jgi:hypothetical protein
VRVGDPIATLDADQRDHASADVPDDLTVNPDLRSTDSLNHRLHRAPMVGHPWPFGRSEQGDLHAARRHA